MSYRTLTLFEIRNDNLQVAVTNNFEKQDNFKEVISNILKGTKILLPQNGFDFIHLNGYDAERLGAAHLTLALNARVSWASRKEDNSKVDLIVTLEHPWINNQVEVILTQIKSGSSFGELINNQSDIKLKISKSKFNDFIGRNHSTLICWLERNSNEFYWFVVKANASFIRGEFNLSHKLTPCSRYDLIRILYSFNNKDGGKGLQFKTISYDRIRMNKYDSEEFKKIRTKAKKAYQELKRLDIISPLFGKIEFTRIGWRHITRESRLNDYKVASYEILPILKYIILKTPTKHYIQSSEEEFDKTHSYRQIEYLLEYDNITIVETDTNVITKTKVFIKLNEAIRFPLNWKENSQLSQCVERRVVFKSIYYKRK